MTQIHIDFIHHMLLCLSKVVVVVTSALPQLVRLGRKTR